MIMKCKVLQIIFFPEDVAYMTLAAIKWKDAQSGYITVYGQPSKLKRVEFFKIEGEEVIAETFHFPIYYLIKWLKENEAIDDKGILSDIEL